MPLRSNAKAMMGSAAIKYGFMASGLVLFVRQPVRNRSNCSAPAEYIESALRK